MLIKIKPPKMYRNIPQCARCQCQGHTKSYCNRPLVCVGSHLSTTPKRTSVQTMEIKPNPANCTRIGCKERITGKNISSLLEIQENFSTQTKQTLKCRRNNNYDK